LVTDGVVNGVEEDDQYSSGMLIIGVVGAFVRASNKLKTDGGESAPLNSVRFLLKIAVKSIWTKTFTQMLTLISKPVSIRTILLMMLSLLHLRLSAKLLLASTPESTKMMSWRKMLVNTKHIEMNHFGSFMS
jgi:hypothetical protein